MTGAQEKKEQTYAVWMKRMEATLQRVLEGTKAEQSRRVLVETQLLTQMEAVKKLFPKEPYRTLNLFGQQDLKFGSPSTVSRDAEATVSSHAACLPVGISGSFVEPEKSTQRQKEMLLNYGELLPDLEAELMTSRKDFSGVLSH